MKQILRKSQFCRGIVRAARELPGDIRRLRGALGRGPIIQHYLNTHSKRKLQIGAGPNELDGWLNADFSPCERSIIFMDATQLFPLPDDSFDLIFSEHMIEHVTFEQGLQMLSECYRVLRPGGTIRIATPNLERIAALETSCPSEEQKRYVAWAIDNHVSFSLGNGQFTPYQPAYVVNNFFWGFGHYFIHDPATLSAALETSGFSDVRSFEPGKSDLPELSALESHAKLIGDEFNLFETMVLQATKK